MPYCKICDAKFPNAIKVGDKWHPLNRRSHCLTCVPFKSSRGGRSKVPPDRVCGRCRRPFHFSRGQGARINRCASCVTADRRIAMKVKLVALKGGKCMKCGYDKHIHALSFHHRDPSKKSHAVLGSNNKSWAAVLAEAEKCDLLCANCHIETHAEMATYASGEAASLSMT